MTSLADANRFSKTQAILKNKALKELKKRLRGLPELVDETELLEFLNRLLPELLDQYGLVAAEAAAQWYEQIHPDANYRAIVERADLSALRGRLDVDTAFYAAKNQQGQDGLAQALFDKIAPDFEREMTRRARRTVRRNVRFDPSKPRWARIPYGKKTCAFCVMLASRGFAYHTQETAGYKEKFHSNCDCRIVPHWGKGSIKGYDPSPYLDLYERGRLVAERAGEPATPENVLKGMRLADPEAFSDSAKFGQGKRKGKGDKSLSAEVWNAYREKVVDRFFATDFPEGQIVKLPPVVPATPPLDWPKDAPKLNAKKWNHILYGEYDKKSSRFRGGHAYGYGWINNGSEFPEEWSKEKIAHEILETIYKPDQDIRGKKQILHRHTEAGLLRVIVDNNITVTGYLVDEKR